MLLYLQVSAPRAASSTRLCTSTARPTCASATRASFPMPSAATLCVPRLSLSLSLSLSLASLRAGERADESPSSSSSSSSSNSHLLNSLSLFLLHRTLLSPSPSSRTRLERTTRTRSSTPYSKPPSSPSPKSSPTCLRPRGPCATPVLPPLVSRGASWVSARGVQEDRTLARRHLFLQFLFSSSSSSGSALVRFRL